MQILDFDAVTVASKAQDSETVENFKTVLKKAYGQSGNDGTLFDMATGVQLPHSTVVAAHIFQRRWHKYLSSLSEFTNIDDARNGLFLYKPVEWAFDRAKLCIELKDGNMTFRLLDPGLKDIKLTDMASELRVKGKREGTPRGAEVSLQTTFGDLDGRKPYFPAESKIWPSKRLLCLHAYASWLFASGGKPDSMIIPPFNEVVDHDDDVSGDKVTKEALRDIVDQWRARLVER